MGSYLPLRPRQVTRKAPALPNTLTQLLDISACGAEYQPIVGLQDQQIYAYEALARFFTGTGGVVSPLVVFQALHSDAELLGLTEMQLKWVQIAMAPEAGRLFINLDPHALTADVREPMLELLTPSRDLVVELIENTDLQDSRACLMLLRSLKEKGIDSALDDIGALESVLSLDLVVNVDFMKFDRRWVNLLERPSYASLFRHLLDFARSTGRKTILEGVETEAQLLFLQDFPLDYVQGFLYKPYFINTPQVPFHE